MEVKGIAVRSTPLFVRQRFADRYDEWLAALPDGSRSILGGKIRTDAWYPHREAFVLPTRVVCDLFFDGQPKGAWEMGRFSADFALWGLLRLFVRIGSPQFLVTRASNLFSRYYRPSRLEASSDSLLGATVRIFEFPDPDELVELRIAGWMERALEISGCTGVQLKVVRSLARGDPVTEIRAEWR